jgi:hypothetical protein
MMKNTGHWKWIGPVIIAMTALALFTSAVAIAGQTVTARPEKVELDGEVDLMDADNGEPSQETITDLFTSIEKTVDNPIGHKFVEFDQPLLTYPNNQYTRVDIRESSVTGVYGHRDSESDLSISVIWTVPVEEWNTDAGVFPLALDGNLSPYTGGSGSGDSDDSEPGSGPGAHWAIQVDSAVGKVTVDRVPMYLYADATAAIPITWTVWDIGNPFAEIHSVVVEWHDGNGIVTSAELKSRTAKGDGFGPAVKNNDINTLDTTYTTWVPNSLISTDIPEDTTNEAYFIVRVVASSHGTDSTRYHLVSDHEADWDHVPGPSLCLDFGVNDGCNPRRFYDINMKVVELYTSSAEFSVLEAATRQTRCMRPAMSKWMVWGHGDTGTWEYEDEPYETEPNSIDFEMLAFANHAKTSKAASEGDKKEMMVSGSLFSNDPGAEFWSRVEGVLYDQTLGCRFGVSYPHVPPSQIAVLAEPAEPGLDLRNNKSTQQTFVLALTHGTPELYIGDLGKTPTSPNIAWDMCNSAYDMTTALLAIWHPGYSAAMFIVKEAATLLFKHLKVPSAEPYDRAEVYAIAGWTQIKADGTPNNLPVFRYRKSATPGGAFVPDSNYDLSEDNLQLEVGDTFVGAIRIGASFMLESVSRGDGRDYDWDKISAYAKYKLTEGTFADTDIIHVHTKPNTQP